jgi:hypothetical protein
MRQSSFISIFLILCFLSCPTSATTVSEIVEKQEQPNIIVRKARITDDLSALQEIYRLKGENFTEDYVEDCPFGSYIALDEKTGTVYGIQTFYPCEKDGVLYAEPVTDLLEKYQSKGIGSLLRRETAKIFDTFIGKSINLASPNEPECLSSSPLSYILSSNEWCFGEYSGHPSLMSQLKAGYGIIAISSKQVLYTAYPPQKGCWTMKREEAFVATSKALMKRFNLEARVKEEEASTEVLIQSLKILLNDLNFEQETDILTLLNFHQTILSLNKVEPEVKECVRCFVKNIQKSTLKKIDDFVLGQRKNKTTQDFSIDTIDSKKGYVWEHWQEAHNGDEAYENKSYPPLPINDEASITKTCETLLGRKC